MGDKKKNSECKSFSSTYIIKKIATQMEGCYLTIDEMTDSINFFTEFIANFLKSEACPEDVKISVPNLGKFSFKNKKGLKAGTKYSTTLDFGLTKDENGKAKMTTVELEEDRPDYLRVWFEVSPKLQKEVREVTERRCNKNNGRK